MLDGNAVGVSFVTEDCYVVRVRRLFLYITLDSFMLHPEPFLE
jgi:hypothetical protein